MIRIIIPPISDCFMPTLGAAQIVGYLKSQNIYAKLYDANQELLQNIKEYMKYNSALQCFFYKNDTPFHVLLQCCNAFSTEHPTVKISLDDFSVDIDWRDVDALISFMELEEEWISIFDNLKCIQDVKEKDVVGLSISYEMQLLPALIISKKIKEKNPLAKVILGGSFFYNYESEFMSVFCALNFIDNVIIGCGELVFEAIFADKFTSLKNLQIWEFEGRQIIDARNISSPMVYFPDFSDIDFSNYPSKAKAFPYMISNRCYYGKCNFCNGDKVTDAAQQKEIKKTFSKISDIANATGINNVYIVDAALSPKKLSVIAKLPSAIKVNWIANARFDKPMLEEGLIEKIASQGCEMLRFGLESGSQKVLNLMNKGTDIAVAEQILKKTYQNGIKNHVYLMFGYWGETDEDRLETLGFLIRARKFIYSYSISFFQPMPNTPVFEKLLTLVSDKDNPYSEMIDIIYGGEDNYNKILKAAKQATDILKGYAYTNAEHYSANIFEKDIDYKTKQAGITIDCRPVVNDHKIIEKIVARLPHRIIITQLSNLDCKTCYILDFYKNSLIEIFADVKLLALLQNDFVGNVDECLSGFDLEQKDIAIDFLIAISQNSDCVAIDNSRVKCQSHSYFSIFNSDNYNLGDSSVQFNPTKQIKNEGGAIWTE